MNRHSLKIRLLAIQAIVIVLALGITGYSLTYLFERHLERRISTELDTYLTQIAARLSFDQTGAPLLGGKLADPRFDKIYSGLYWQIDNETAGQTARSRSLWDTRLTLPADTPGRGKVHVHTITDPRGALLLVHERRLVFQSPIGEQTALLIVALDLAELSVSSGQFASEVAVALLILAGFLLAAGWVQVVVGLRPLALIRKSIAAVRSGVAARINTDMPDEVLPLADEVNDLLAAQETAISKARYRANNLAHNFKTPLTALNSDVRRLRKKGEHAIAADIEATSLLMRRQIERELTKARIRDPRAMPAIKVRPVIEGIVATVRRTPDGEQCKFEIRCDAALRVQINTDDLSDILGNLVENAVKHGNGQVIIKVQSGNGFALFAVEDDGQGISGDLREIAQERGVRLDQSVAGSGLGLAIISDILDAYNQSLKFDTSPLGGLQVSFQIPVTVAHRP